MTDPTLRRLLATTLLSLLAACGGGGDSKTGSTQKPDVSLVPPATTAPGDPDAPGTSTPGDTIAPPPLTTPPAGQAAVTFTRQEASRFLGRATFGPNMAAIDALAASDS
ncbi:MAG: DUF1800 domain-containing protein, partial [Janthinobacterium sp.]